jgi:phosphoribosyl 1,2-cyclic phosphodiesterase
VRVSVLGSGSRGNCLVIDGREARIIVDVGFGPRATATRLRALGIAPESIAGAVITHEHQDHAQGAPDARTKWRWSLIGTPGTLQAMSLGMATARLLPTAVETPLLFEGLRITLHEIPHDASAPAAVVIEDLRTGERVGVAHDLGVVPPRLVEVFRDVDIAVVESNHDPVMLREGPYPPMLQRRVSGGRGHLSNAQCAAWLRDIAGPRLRHVVLAHLSETNNTAALATDSARAALGAAGCRATVVAAQQRAPVVIGTPPDRQMTLW